jgi:antidote-toxin recognition MazE-like antitoxin
MFDRERVDYLFALVGDGRRWFIPANALEAARAVKLGGMKYSEFEVEPGTPFEALIYPDDETNRITLPIEGECQSGQMDVTVNHTAMPTQVRILPPPSTTSSRRQVLLRPKRQVTIPKLPRKEAGVEPGDRLRVRADGHGRVLLERI